MQAPSSTSPTARKQKASKREKPLTLTNPPVLQAHSRCYKWFLFALIIIYLTIILAVALGTQIYPIFVALFALVQFLLILCIGRYAIKAVLFPYGNKIVTNYLDSQLNAKFGNEFAKILERTYYSIKENMVEPISQAKLEEQEQKSFMINNSIISACEVIALYSEINQKCINGSDKSRKKPNQQFKELTRIMFAVKDILKKILIRIEQPYISNEKEILIPFWSAYSSEEIAEINIITAIHDMKGLPRVLMTDDTQKQLDNFLELILEFKHQVQLATKPVRCFCCRTSCLCCFKGIFGTLAQLRCMLEKNFDGKHFWVQSKIDSVKIDAMFFPSTSENVLTKDQLERQKNQPAYLNKPTIIMCNPNALFYHHMVNSPNAFWLNFFLKKGINVMAWNYRGYGETQGSPNPYNIKIDGESILYFVVNELKITGKIGIYGRSLGGVVATHVAANFPSHISLLIADRTFGNLKNVSTRKFIGFGTSMLYDLISCKWETNNDINFLKAPCYKISTCDPKDDVVDEYASLTTTVAQKACEEHLKSEFLDLSKRKQFYQLLCLIFQIEEELYSNTKVTVPGGKNRKSKYEVIGKKTQLSTGKSPNQNEDEYLHIDLSKPNSQNTSSASKSKSLSTRSSSKSLYKHKMTDCKLLFKDIQKLLQKEASSKVSNMEYLEELGEDINALIVLLNDLSGGIIKLGEVCGLNRIKQSKDFELFLYNFFTYGSNYEIGDSSTMFSLQAQRERAQFELGHIQYRLQKTIQHLEKQQGSSQFAAYLLLIFQDTHTFFTSLSEYMGIILQTLPITYKHVGHIVPMKCGHRGRPNKSEEKLVENLLRDSNFIYNPFDLSRSLSQQNVGSFEALDNDDENPRQHKDHDHQGHQKLSGLLQKGGLAGDDDGDLEDIKLEMDEEKGRSGHKSSPDQNMESKKSNKLPSKQPEKKKQNIFKSSNQSADKSKALQVNSGDTKVTRKKKNSQQK